MRDAEEVVRAYIDACNDGDLHAVVALLDPEIELHEAETLPGAVHPVGIESVKRYLERFEAHWSSFDWEPIVVEPAGDGRVAVEARLRLTGRRSGIVVDRRWAYLFRVRDGKLLRQEGFDTLAELRERIADG